VLTAGQLNVHDLLTHDVVLFAEAALDRIGGGRKAVAATTTDDDSATTDDAAGDDEEPGA
jgi:hypothetical protein